MYIFNLLEIFWLEKLFKVIVDKCEEDMYI